MPDPYNNRTHPCVVIGGTFDVIHAGHKSLLTEAVLRCRKRLTVGVSDDKMVASKTLPEFILPCQKRIVLLREFLIDCDANLEYNIVPISDPFGPSIVEEDLTLIVGSQETERGCQKVNEVRVSKGLSQLEVITVSLESDSSRMSNVEEAKVSSSTRRMRLLGTMLKPPFNEWNRESGPYIIGLAGGSASGKSSVGKRLEKLGAGVVDCDKMAHKAYEKGTPCYDKLVQTFGNEIVGDDGVINRAVLGKKVFGSAENKAKLESIVWPEVREMSKKEAFRLWKEENKSVVFLDAAALLTANWHQTICHQVGI